jgi:protein-glucosylgalactosylhydroxylysine glucosidase
VALVSAFAGEHPLRQIEGAAPAPYRETSQLTETSCPMPPHQVRDLEQSYYFSTGELSSTFIFAASRNAVRCEVLTFASREDPTLVCQERPLAAERAQSNDRRCRYLRARAAPETKHAPLRDRPPIRFYV